MKPHFSRWAAGPLLGSSLLLSACVTDGMFAPEPPGPAPIVMMQEDVLPDAMLLDVGQEEQEGARRKAALAAFSACRDDALMLDEQAQTSSDAAKYLASARLLETCEAEVAFDVAPQLVDPRMRAMALSIQNYVKGGDLNAARAGLSRFVSSFPGQDLYYGDGTSFLDSFSVLLDGRMGSGELTLANARSEVKSEIRRLRFWQRN